MKMVKLVIETNNNAFHPIPEYEISRILKKYGGLMEVEGARERMILDANGNRTGFITVR